MRKTVKERFEKKVAHVGECWIWTGATSSSGAGAFYFGRGVGLITARRASWLLYRGDLPPHTNLLPTCGNIECVRPEHLGHRVKVDDTEWRRITTQARFEAKVIRSEGCWDWQACTIPGGYGQFYYDEEVGITLAHRASWLLYRGPIPDGLSVLHTCDRPVCVAPHHLFLGTQQDNIDDKLAKGRQAQGSAHGLAVLSERKVMEMRLAREEGIATAVLAEFYGIDRTAAHNAIVGKTWKHVTETLSANEAEDVLALLFTADDEYREAKSAKYRANGALGIKTQQERAATRTHKTCKGVLCLEAGGPDGVVRPLSDFYGDSKGGTMNVCKECHKARCKTRYEANLDRSRAKHREYSRKQAAKKNPSPPVAADPPPPVPEPSPLLPGQIPLFGNRRNWERLPPDEVEAYARRLFDHYRQAGYPYQRLSADKKSHALRLLLAYREQVVIRDDGNRKTICGGSHCMGLCWSYFPHAIDVGRLGRPTPLSAFSDDATFMKVIRKRLRYGSYISDAGIRKALKLYCRVATVSNFRPAAAVAVYRHFGRERPLRVWDMSSGFGGRMLGAWASGAVSHYTGTEPCTSTYDGLLAMRTDLLSLGVLPDVEVDMYKVGSEDFLPEEGSLDLCFTSPPYFSTERYSDEPTQSALRFPDYAGWLKGFLRQTMLNCRHGLRSGGHLVLNVANVKAAPNLTLDTVMEAHAVGFLVEDRYDMTVASTKGGYKYEPILVFRRP